MRWETIVQNYVSSFKNDPLTWTILLKFSDVMHEKRSVEHDPAFIPLTPTAKAKTRQVLLKTTFLKQLRLKAWPFFSSACKTT